MRPLIALTLFALASCAVPDIHAQVAAYLTYSPVDFMVSGDPYAGDAAGGIANGGTIGLSFEHLHEGRFVTALDLRDTFATKTHAQGNIGAIDYRVAFVPHRVPLKPFIELGLGIVSVRDPNGGAYAPTPSATNAALDLALGLDIRLTPSLDLRLGDQGDAPFRSGYVSSPSVAASVLQLGVLYHFTQRP